ncbi:hypothetical protein [Mycobacteroides abscessus]
MLKSNNQLCACTAVSIFNGTQRAPRRAISSDFGDEFGDFFELEP